MQSSVATGDTGRSRIDTMRILSQDDFARIEKLREDGDVSRLVKGPNGKRTRQKSDTGDDARAVNTNTVLGADLIGYRKRVRQTKEERVAQMKEGIADRPKFGSKRG